LNSKYLKKKLYLRNCLRAKENIYYFLPQTFDIFASHNFDVHRSQNWILNTVYVTDADRLGSIPGRVTALAQR